MAGIVAVGKRTLVELKNFVLGIEEVNKCLVCTAAFTVDSSATLAAYYFCSVDCYRRYLILERDSCKGRDKCLKSECTRTCNSNGYQLFDYCSRRHADEHIRWLAGLWSKNVTRHHSCCYSSSQTSHNRQISQESLLQFQDQDGSSAPILFYRRDAPYFEFTNFAEFPIVIEGLQYPTSEHYFQSQKLIGTPFVAHICQLPSARQAFEFPRQPHVSRWVRKDWQEVKEDVMYRALVAKFQQHRLLQFRLIRTGRRELVEHSPYDSYWGDGPDGKGLNKLGKLLMRLREVLILVRDQGKLIPQADHDSCIPTSSTNLHSSKLNINNSPPHGERTEADGDSACQADDSAHVPSNDSRCNTEECTPQETISTQLALSTLSPLLTSGSGDTSTSVASSKAKVVTGDFSADVPFNDSSCHNEECPLKGSADTSIPMLNKAVAPDSSAGDDPSSMEVCQENGDRTADSHQEATANEDPLPMEVSQKNGDSTAFTQETPTTSKMEDCNDSEHSMDIVDLQIKDGSRNDTMETHNNELASMC